LWSQIGIGSLGLAPYCATLPSVKGSLRHRRSGRPLFIVLLATVVVIPPVVVLRPVPFDPRWIVSPVYLSASVFTVVTMAWTAIRWKDQPERFRGLHFRLLGPLLVVLGTVVTATSASWLGVH
jgi:hypothetical protein